MSKARGFVYEDGIGLRMTRQNTRYASGGEWKTPFKIHYLDIEYDLDKNGNQLFNTDGTKKIKEKKWEPFLHAVPVPGETVSGGTSNHFVKYAGLSAEDLGTTIYVYPLNAIANAGFDADAVLMMNGNVTFIFNRKEDGSTIRLKNFNYMLAVYEVVGSEVYYASVGEGWDNGRGNSFEISVRCRDLDHFILVWTGVNDGFNNGWNPDLETSYTLRF